ncbi:hypothetical protein FisN_11Lh186 [Fistulifera solaris]|uniref:Uncharacterized protein n=1 Tax=Fistulifera solaris TaxID=1519565 RepID=A0A1Z5J7C1_FISSO|nr:hypothetical protein FisN_11Lh186 [Fistulifera solaris]|eukprot:GAX09836.1 hypothetical protein FisN_11Lh186 [Fistulifera solaris]
MSDGPYKFTVDGFEDYDLSSEETPPGLIAFFSVYVGVSLILAIPIICWRDKKITRGMTASSRQDDPTSENGEIPVRSEQEMVEMTSQPPLTPVTIAHSTDMMQNNNFAENMSARPEQKGNVAIKSEENWVGEIPALSNMNLQPNETAPERPVASLGQPSRGALNNSFRVQHDHNAQPGERRRSGSSSSSMLAARRPWGHSRPLGRADFVMRSLETERQSQASEEGSFASRRSRSSRGSRQVHSSRVRRSVSDAASSVLSEEVVEGEAEFYRRRYIRRARQRSRSALSESDNSIMPPLSPDVLSPEDAADAHDVGRVNRIEDYQPQGNAVIRWGPLRMLCGCFDHVLDLAETDYESRRMLELAIPASVGALADPLFRLVLIAIISHYVERGTDSMTAFVLVVLFVRLTTEEVSGAVTDVESSLLKEAISQGGDEGFQKAGYYVQLAIIMQIIVGAPILLVWALVIDDVVKWLVRSDSIAEIAAPYAKIIIVDYILRGTTQAFMLPFHLSGQAHFERTIDVFATLLTFVVVVAIAVTSTDTMPTLENIGWIQVIIGIAKTITKVTYAFQKGWVRQYQKGVFGRLSLMDPRKVLTFFMQVVPLFVGSFLELGEWDVLVLFARYLGGAEVAAFAVVGNLWEVCLSATEGLGESASVRVTYYLSEGFPVDAKLLSSKVAFWACVQALVITSIFLVAGPNISESLTTDTCIGAWLARRVGMPSHPPQFCCRDG